jgi:adenylylsulfate kinase-like enzyme
MVPAPDGRTKTTIDPFLVALYEDRNNIVGIDGARDEIIAKLCEGDDASKLQLKILSIVGFGGLGKTTLAKVVYDSLEDKFDSRAFVSVSRIFNAMQVFKDIYFQLDDRKYKTLNIGELFNESQLIDQLRRLLQTRR